MAVARYLHFLSNKCGYPLLPRLLNLFQATLITKNAFLASYLLYHFARFL
jgi:hypothetical protein